MAYFRADLCLHSPESYTFDENRDICNGMIESSKAILDAMCEDFLVCPPELRPKLLTMTCESGPKKVDWWQDVLVARGDQLYRELEAI